MNSFWKDRLGFVTGGTGLLGSWLVSQLIDNGANVVCLVRDWVPQSELVSSRRIDQVKTIRGDVSDRELIERALGEYEVEVVFHVAAQAIVGVANRNPISTFSTNVAGTWSVLEACRRVAQSQFGRGGFVRQGLRRASTSSLRREHGAARPSPLRRQQVLRRHDCTDLRRELRSAGCHHPLRKLLWRWRPQLEPRGPGTIRSILRGERPVIRSDGKFVRDYFYIEDGAAAYMLLGERLASNLALRGQAFNFSNESQISVLELVDQILRKMNSQLRPEIQNQASNEIRHQYLSAERARTLLKWRPQYTLDTGLDRTIAWYRDFLGVPAAMAHTAR